MSETEFSTPREFQVGIILNGRDYSLGTYYAGSEDQAKTKCADDIQHAAQFNLWAREVEA